MSMQVKGTLQQVLKLESGVSKAGKEWTKQDFVLLTNEQFPKTVCFTLFGDKTSLIEGIGNGSEMEVYFSIESRDFNGKWYHNINAWKIEVTEKASQGNDFGLVPKNEVPDAVPEDAGNDLPF